MSVETVQCTKCGDEYVLCGDGEHQADFHGTSVETVEQMLKQHAPDLGQNMVECTCGWSPDKSAERVRDRDWKRPDGDLTEGIWTETWEEHFTVVLAHAANAENRA